MDWARRTASIDYIDFILAFYQNAKRFTLLGGEFLPVSQCVGEILFMLINKITTLLSLKLAHGESVS